MTSSLASPLTLPFGFTREVPRRMYVAWGVLLFLLRYTVEAAVVDAFTGRSLGLLTFLTPYFGRPSALTIAAGPLGVTLLLSAVPFLWVAVSMSVRRAAAAGVPEALGFLVLVPGVHYVAMAALAALPDMEATPPSPRATGPFREPPAVDEVLAPGLRADRLLPAMVTGFFAAVTCALFLAGTDRPAVWIFLLGPVASAFVAARHYRSLMPRPAEEPEAEAVLEPKPEPKPAQPARTGGGGVFGGTIGCAAALLVIILVLLAAALFGGWVGWFAWLAVVASPIICLVGAAIGATSGALGSHAGVPVGHGLGAVLALALPVGLATAWLIDGPLVLLGSVFAIIAAILAIVVKALIDPWGR